MKPPGKGAKRDRNVCNKERNNKKNLLYETKHSTSSSFEETLIEEIARDSIKFYDPNRDWQAQFAQSRMVEGARKRKI